MADADDKGCALAEPATVRFRASVILALGAPPNAACVASWVAQTCPADDFEIVVVAPTASMTKDVEALRALLRPHDRLVLPAADASRSLYDVGVAASSGHRVVLTHDRMVADPSCIEASLNSVDAFGIEAATLRWGMVSRRGAARFDELASEQLVRDWNRIDVVSRVRAGGFIITRSAYDAAGGWDGRYGLYGESLLAARLHRDGVDVQLIGSKPLVRSVATCTMRGIAEEARRRVRGECDFVADRTDPRLANRYSLVQAQLASTSVPTADIRELEERIACHRAVVGQPASAAAGSSSARDLGARPAEETHRTRTVLGGFGDRVANRIQRAAARMRFRLLWSESARLRAFGDFRQLSEQRCRRSASRHMAKGFSTVLDSQNDTSNDFDVHDLGHLGMFELDRGVPFRWSTPVATHRLALGVGDWALHFDTGAIRGAADGLEVDFYWNGQPVPAERVSRNTSWLSVRVTADGTRTADWITTVVAPLERGDESSDNRRLGLPLRRIRVEVVHADTAAPVCPVSEPRPLSHLPTKTKVLLVNTSDLGGGAEIVATSLHRGYRNCGLDSWLVVGDKKTNGDGSIISMFASPLVDYAPVQTLRSQITTRARRAVGDRLGIEDFEWPQTALLAGMTGAPPDVLHLHNLHGGYFDLRQLPELTHARPTFLTLHDEWSYTGHCAYSVDCDRWERNCGSCPALESPPAVTRDATRFNLGRKAGIYERSRLFVGAPSAWLARRAERSVLAPAIVESRVIPNGIDLDVFRPGSRTAARARLGLPAEGFVAAFAASAGSETSYKGFETLRASFGRLGALGGPEIHLVAAGREQPAEHRGRLTIHHLPRLAPDDMAQLYRASDVYVHAARAETQGLVLLEAMACGTPVVATNVGGAAEAVTDGEHGLLVAAGNHDAFADAVERLMGDTQLRMRLGRAAVTRAHRDFDERVMVRRYLDWFDDVLHVVPPSTLVPQKVDHR